MLAHGLRCALTGGLAIDGQLRLHGRAVEQRGLNDIDFVVEDFASIPGSLAAWFLQHHVHPDAIDNARTSGRIPPRSNEQYASTFSRA